MSFRFTAKNCTLALASFTIGLASPAFAQDGATQKPAISDPSAYLLEKDIELELARTAGPTEIGENATLLVLRADGEYVPAVQGTNGWTCFNGRSWAGPSTYENGKRIWSDADFNPKIRAPQCFNGSGAQSILAIHRLTTKLFMAGASADEVDQAIGNAFSSGTIKQPEVGAMSYMYSPKQFLNERVGRFMPHMMLYTPFVTQAHYGAFNPQLTVPMVVDGGSIYSTTVIMSPLWSDGTSAHSD